MLNVYDIRYEKNLYFILPENRNEVLENHEQLGSVKAAVVLYLYYVDTLEFYYTYINAISDDIDIYIISSLPEVLKKAKEHEESFKNRNITYILKENRGRDISALLIESKDIVNKYEYVCFLHDKKEHISENKRDVNLWVENLWGNLLGGTDYIHNILNVLKKNTNLGVLVPPEPIGDHFNTWYGFAWHNSFAITKEIAERLQLVTDIREDKPPITIGTALWFRSSALKKLFEYDWKYLDFDDNKLENPHYLSYGIERIFAYVAQDAGYDTGTVMSVSYAQRQTSYLQYALNSIMSETQPFFPLQTVSFVEYYSKNKNRVLKFARENKNVYLYGAGEVGKFTLSLLRKENLAPKAFIVSEENGVPLIDGLQVVLLSEINTDANPAVIVTVRNVEVQNEIIQNLKRAGINNYIIFGD